MKHKGSYAYYEDLRNRDLMRAYRLCRQMNVPHKRLYEYIVACSAQRYWVSEERAYSVIIRLCRGEDISDMRPMAQRMFHDIWDEVARLNTLRPHASLYELVFEAVNSPAPCFYLTPGSAKVIIHKIRSGFYERRKLRKASSTKS